MGALKDLLRLMRLPLVFTVLGDQWLACALTRGAWTVPPASLWCSGACLYLGGMVLNDWRDRDRDKELHPGRPLPAGRVAPASALALALTLLAAGVGLALFHGPASARWAAAGLASLVVAYDLALKRFALAGSAALGGCRGLQALLGVAGAGGALGRWHAGTAAAAVLAVYGFGLTWVSTREERASWASPAVRAGLWGYFPLEVGLGLAGGLGPAAAFPLALAAPAAAISRWLRQRPESEA